VASRYKNFARLRITNQDTSLQALIRRASGKDGKRHASWLHFNALPAAGTASYPAAGGIRFQPRTPEAAGAAGALENQPQKILLAELFQLSSAEHRLTECWLRGCP
jgi:hypothetical protein